MDRESRMYCPVCFQNTLKLRSTGVVKLVINQKLKSTSLFTFNLLKEKSSDLDHKCRERIIDFLEWYLTFKNRDPIKSYELYSSDVQCQNGCKLDLSQVKISVVGVLYSPQQIRQWIMEECQKKQLAVQLTTEKT